MRDDKVYDVMPTPFSLTNGDKVSQTWLKLRAHMEEELRIARAKNDDVQGKITPDETARLRGDIRTLKRLIALGDTLPVITDS